MTDYNSDQARELRRARLTTVRPNNALAKMDERQYTTTYKGRHMVVREMMTEVEEAERIMFCPACQEQVDDAMIAVRQLHVSYEEDPLRNYRALVTLDCKGCGWNEIVPVEAPPRLSEEELTALREAGSFRARDQYDALRNQGMATGIANQSVGGLLNSQQWSSEMQRQLMKQSVLGQMYGAGPNTMKALMNGRVGSIYGMSIHEAQAKKPVPVRGQALADAVWSDYAELDKMRAEATRSKEYLESRRLHDKIMNDMATQLAKKIDQEVLDSVTAQAKAIAPAPRPKYAVAPPPAPKLDQHDKEAMREMLMEEVKRANGDPSRVRQAIAKVKEFFT